MLDRGRGDPQPKAPMLATLSNEARARHCKAMRAQQAEAVVAGVAQEVERIGQQRGRLRGQASADLDGEHREVDRERHPQDAR